MAGLYKVIRFFIVTLLLLAVAVPALLYVLSAVPAVQHKIRDKAEEELTVLLGTRVGIDDVIITPFNKVTLRRVMIEDCNGDTALSVRRLGTGISLSDLIWKQRLVFNYAEIIGLDARLSRDTVGAPLNIDCIIEALKPKETNKPPTEFDFRINAIVIRQANFTYDVDKAPWLASGVDANHLRIEDLNADLRLPSMKRDDYTIDLRRLAFSVPSVLRIDGVECLLHLTPAFATADNLSLNMPETKLKFAPLRVDYGNWSKMPKDRIARIPLDVELLEGSYIAMSDLKHLLRRELPATVADKKILLDFLITGNVDNPVIKRFNAGVADLRGASQLASISLEGSVKDLITDSKHAGFDIEDLKLNAKGKWLSEVANSFGVKQHDILGNAGEIGVKIASSGNLNDKRIPDSKSMISIATEAGKVSVEAVTTMMQNGDAKVSGEIHIDQADIKKLMAGHGKTENLPGPMTGLINSDIVLNRKGGIDGTTVVRIDEIEYKGKVLENINATAKGLGKRFELALDVDDDGFDVDVDGSLDLNDPLRKEIVMELTANDVELGLIGGKPGTELSFTAGGNMALITSGEGMQSLDGMIEIQGLTLLSEEQNKKLSISKIEIDAKTPVDSIGWNELTITSDLLEANLNGQIDPLTLAGDMKTVAATFFPALIEMPVTHKRSRNDFDFNIRVLTTQPIEQFVKLPVQIRYPVVLDGEFVASTVSGRLDFSAPYLWQGNKEINATSLHLDFDGRSIGLPESKFTATTNMPTKNGRMTVDLNYLGKCDEATVTASWKVDSNRDFSGSLNMIGNVERSKDTGKPTGQIRFLPGELVFNDTVWNVSPSVITIENNRIDVDRFRVGRQGQFVTIDGTASALPEDSIQIVLQDVDLDYVFETLNISNAMFGGIASGVFNARDVLTSKPIAYTDNLHVKGLKYNFSLMGDADIKADFDAEKPAVNLYAYITQPNGRHSSIEGYIKPTSEGYIDLDMKADKIAVGFMKPFMEAFASAVGGYASGRAHLFGTFHDVNMSGDIFAEDLSLKLDFTGTTYWATDSVHLEPGFIDLKDITLRDRDGNSGKLNGWLRHTNFHEPRFEFNISNAKDLLVYDVPSTPDQVWYGTIYGNGGAQIHGVPGRIDIKVDMSTAPKSTFTFVLSDAEEAYDYTFITFRDRETSINGIEDVDFATPDIVKAMRKQLAKKTEQEGASVYDMDLTVRVNDNANLVVVMDPVGGDAIKARGDGVMTMTYNSASEELGLRGDYTLESGTYNFTFQDIIRKDFRIYPGSTIRFNGDPYSAQLDITAGYRLTANLSDLDESFLDDPELTRTSVPVEAEIIITGDMRQPEIGYDFSFPTLKDDVKRKVNSIVSTEDMRARQMLYLLALSRFYTPDYMSATKGNELVSMASSTISSQLSNVLGQLTDKWSIAPNIRSDRGDFSDVEFDLALSSSLLDNRLLFNGNFGYRDKALNNNSFVGDFDIEYLLNHSGSLRLKAYNRYNDQNFYVKNALTTQGVGVVYRRDFDDMLSFLKAFKKKKKDKGVELKSGQKEEGKSDTLQIEEPVDSLLILK